MPAALAGAAAARRSGRADLPVVVVAHRLGRSARTVVLAASTVGARASDAVYPPAAHLSGRAARRRARPAHANVAVRAHRVVRDALARRVAAAAVVADRSRAAHLPGAAAHLARAADARAVRARHVRG